MDPEFETFLNSVGLSGDAADTLRARFQHNASSKVALACQAAEFSLGKDIVDTAPLNQTVVWKNWSQANVAEPYCIVQPTSAADVSRIIKILSYFQIKFAVRSGGHSPNPGFSSVGDAGVLLDLQKVNEISINDEKTIVTVGPGCRWGDVISFLDFYGTTVIGGRIPSVGVGGLILGGGLSHFSSRYGLAADNVKNFEIVLSDGTITNANAEENTDLFWALKGGGPNFGIVTRFDLYTVPCRDIWQRFSVHPIDQADDVFDAFANWQINGSSDTKSTVITGISLDSIVIGLVYAEPVKERPEAFVPFYDLPALSLLSDGVNSTVANLTTMMGVATRNTATRHDYRAASSRIDAQLYKDIFAFWRERALAVREATGANQTFVLQPISKNVAEQGIAKGGNAMGIPIEDHQWWTTLVDWTEAADDDVVRAVSIETTAQWAKLGRERGLYVPHIYQDDASRDQNPLASYGAENLKKLKKISLKYDESQFFQKLQNGGFLLSKI